MPRRTSWSWPVAIFLCLLGYQATCFSLQSTTSETAPLSDPHRARTDLRRRGVSGFRSLLYAEEQGSAGPGPASGGVSPGNEPRVGAGAKSVTSPLPHTSPSNSLAAKAANPVPIIAGVVQAAATRATPGGGQPSAGSPPSPARAAPQAADGPAYATICAAMKDQHTDVRGWVAYHRAIGVGKFYLVDTGSGESMQSVLQDHIDSGLVDFTYDSGILPTRGTHGPQLGVYQQCIAKASKRNERWMALIDLDEFLVIRDATPDLPTLLHDYESAGALVVNWVVFGSSGQTVRSPLEPLASFWMCAPDQHSENLHVKSIVQPARVAGVTTDPHHLKYVEPYFAVNTTHDRVDGPKSERQALDRLALYHYALKSEEEYQAKMKRGSGMGNQKTMAFFHYVNNYTTAVCLDGIDKGRYLASFVS
ncbi:hypothetical protein ACKKBF_B33120 [Auxenochlorella protothecoides x Auxenochlorella symbiontica]